MENVLSAVIIIFILLFGILTLSSTFMSAQEMLLDAWQAMSARQEELNQTAITLSQIRILNSGALVEVTVRNNGGTKLANYDDWDVFAAYYDSAETPVYYTRRMHYNNAAPSNNVWGVEGIYLNAAAQMRERYDPGILNSGEEMILHVLVSPAVGVGQSAQVTVTTANGVSASLIGTRNAPPTLTANTGLKVANGGSALITAQMLAAEDIDNEAGELVYTITMPPEQGTLTSETFTQAQIVGSQIVYTHTGEGEDSFGFTISDGLETIGEYLFPITVNTPPVLEISAGLVVPAGDSAVITNILLKVTDEDEDDPPSDLIYTIVQFPSNGLLSFGSTFSQADIDNHRMTYTHTDTDADMFTFVISDGYDVIGTYTFLITLVEEPIEP